MTGPYVTLMTSTYLSEEEQDRSNTTVKHYSMKSYMCCTQATCGKWMTGVGFEETVHEIYADSVVINDVGTTYLPISVVLYTVVT